MAAEAPDIRVGLLLLRVHQPRDKWNGLMPLQVLATDEKIARVPDVL